MKEEFKEFRNKSPKSSKRGTAGLTLVMPIGRFRLNNNAIDLLKIDYAKQGVMFLRGKGKIKIVIEETKEFDNYHINKLNVFTNQNLGFMFAEVFSLNPKGSNYFTIENNLIKQV